MVFPDVRQTYAEHDEAMAQVFGKLREGLDGAQP